ncbi:uncharacterized protein BP5553_02829 [Venustampulla echinocandica]|uniref:Uncharacterized protein n=1 Tax=Venustampulla echinocandica TaxID=2656787 RepID=A0A370TSH7_9HELO|nr:uncharacterized protein BP5553_02829 [Venustampulla echinocandica]RDL38489.1 hypothetical protein BP5553_02829 [Venustampulla echinocandica]
MADAEIPVEAPKAEAPKVDAEKPADAPKAGASETATEKPASTPKVEAPKADDEKAAEAPKADAPKAVAPKADAPKEDAPKEDAPKEAAPKEDAPKEDAPKEDAPKEDAPKEDAPKDAPKADAEKPVDTPKAETEPTPPATSVTEAIAEHVIVEAGTAVVKEITKKSDEDLKTIGKGLHDEFHEETKDGLPSLSDIGGAIVNGVETVIEEVIEGAEVVVNDIKAHPELIAEGALVLGIGIASLVQPELIVGSVAMVGKMAADHAKQTASKIAVEASSHVVEELRKDITEGTSNDAAVVEATTTQTDVTTAQTTVDGTTGDVVAKESKLSSQETKIVITGGNVAVSSDTSETAPETSPDAKDSKSAESPKVENEKPGNSTEDDSTAEAKSETASNEPSKKGLGADDSKSGSSVIVMGGDKSVSVKISEDGTITIGTEASSKTEIVKTVTASGSKSDSETTKEEAPEKEVVKDPEDTIKDSEQKAEIEKVAEVVPGEAPQHNAETENEKNREVNLEEEPTKTSPTEAATLESEKVPEETTETAETQNIPEVDSLTKDGQELVVPQVIATKLEKHVEQTAKPADSKSAEPSVGKDTVENVVVQNDSHIHKSLDEIHQKLNALISPVAKVNSEAKDPEVVAPSHAHTHESLAQIHQKLNDLAASDSKAKEVVPSPPDADSQKTTQDALDKIHLKLDTLVESHSKVKEDLATSNRDVEQEVRQEDLEKIHTKLDALIVYHQEVKESAAATVPGQAITQEDIQNIHLKLDTMQEALAIKPTPTSEDKSNDVHQKMDIIHQAILANTKSADALVASREVAEASPAPASTEIDNLHKKFDTMQAAINKLTAALSQKLETDAATTELPGVSNIQGESGPPEEAKAVSEVGNPISEASENAPEVPASDPVATNNEGLNETPTAVATTNEETDSTTTTSAPEASTTETSADATSNSDNKTDDASTNTKAAETKPVTKHVKRSSFFGGIFG